MATTTVAAYESESVVEAEDFYPYGATRIDTNSGGYGGEKRKYAGTEYDAISGLNYAQARYQSPTRGQFVSEDPTFLGAPSQQNLKDPQTLNSYSYANDNPINAVDPTGLATISGTGKAILSQLKSQLLGAAELSRIPRRLVGLSQAASAAGSSRAA